MNIYIAYNYEDEPTSVLLADDREKVNIAWAAMKLVPHRVEEIDPTAIQGIGGVGFLLTSEEANSRDYTGVRGGDYRIWKRGV